MIPIITEIDQIVCFQVRGITEVATSDGSSWRTKAAYEAAITA